MENYNAFWTGETCSLCVKEYPTKPAKRNGTCMTCKEAHPERPYWNFTHCVAESSRGKFKVAGVVLVEATFVFISVYKFVMFMNSDSKPMLSACQLAAVVIAFFCVGCVVILISIIAFADISNKTLFGLLGGVGACFVLASCSVATFAGLGQEGEDGSDDADQGVGNRENIRTLIELGKQGDRIPAPPKKDAE